MDHDYSGKKLLSFIPTEYAEETPGNVPDAVYVRTFFIPIVHWKANCHSSRATPGDQPSTGSSKDCSQKSDQEGDQRGSPVLDFEYIWKKHFWSSS